MIRRSSAGLNVRLIDVGLVAPVDTETTPAVQGPKGVHTQHRSASDHTDGIETVQTYMPMGAVRKVHVVVIAVNQVRQALLQWGHALSQHARMQRVIGIQASKVLTPCCQQAVIAGRRHTLV